MSQSSDTWSKLQEHKRQHENLKERLAKRRKERQGLLTDISTPDGVKPDQSADESASKKIKTEPGCEANDTKEVIKFEATEELLKLLSRTLCHKEFPIPSTASDIAKFIERHKLNESSINITHNAILSGLEKLEAQSLLTVKKESTSTMVVDAELLKLQALHGKTVDTKASDSDKKVEVEQKDAIQSLLSMPTMKEVENKKLGNEILDLLNEPTAKEKSLVEKFKSQG